MEEEIRQEDDAEELVFEIGHEEDVGGYFIHDARSSGRWLFGPDWEGPFRLAKGMDNLGGRLETAGKLLYAGVPAARAAKVTGLSEKTAIKLRRLLEIASGETLKCPCGQDARHFGQCDYRASLSLPEAQRKYVAIASKNFAQWMARRAFVRPVAEGHCDDPGFQSLSAAITRRIASERRFSEASMRENIEAALPQLGEEPLRMMAIWLRCARPKPSYGEFRRILKERAAAGEFSRVGYSNKAPFVRVKAGSGAPGKI